MHGHTKIQFFDAKTGKLTDEVEKDNIFTGAVEAYIFACLLFGMNELVRDNTAPYLKNI